MRITLILSLLFVIEIVKLDVSAQLSNEHLKTENGNDENSSFQPDRNRPNIILILADDLGFGDLGIANHPTSRTPNIDALAEGGVVLNQFYVTAPVCSPSRSSLLTGRYNVRSGVYPGTFTPDNYLGLPHNETTIATLMKKNGYRTQMVGKWHLGVGYKREYLPTSFGFDDFLGLPYSHDMCDCPICFPDNITCAISCWEGYVSCALFNNSEIIEQPVHLPTLTQRFLGRSLKFIKSAAEDEVPFFLYFAFHHIHHPQFGSIYGKSHRGRTGDSLLEMDSAVGKLMQTVKELGIDDKTITWFTSDNGPSLARHQYGGCAGPLRCGKGTTWDGGVRVPSIVHWPNHFAIGKRSFLSSSLDILPTLANLSGISFWIDELDGIDIKDALVNLRDESPREFFAIYPESPTPYTSPFAVVYKNFKAHYFTRGSDLSDSMNYDPMCPSSHHLTRHTPPLLFDLNEDPGERYDLSHKEEYKDILSIIDKWRRKHIESMTWMQPRTRPIDPQAQPCCTNRNCEPFPSCCDCPTTPQRDKYPGVTSVKEENNLMAYLRKIKHSVLNI